MIGYPKPTEARKSTKADATFSGEVVELIWNRDGGCCVKCGHPQDRERRGDVAGGWSIQHREARGRSGSKGRPHLALASNGAILCGTGTTGCHGEVEADLEKAREQGYSVSALGIRRPADVPMLHALFGRVWLDDKGGWSTEPPTAPELIAA